MAAILHPHFDAYNSRGAKNDLQTSIFGTAWEQRVAKRGCDGLKGSVDDEELMTATSKIEAYNSG